jgi:hypothetical protein
MPFRAENNKTGEDKNGKEGKKRNMNGTGK